MYKWIVIESNASNGYHWLVRPTKLIENWEPTVKRVADAINWSDLSSLVDVSVHDLADIDSDQSIVRYVCQHTTRYHNSYNMFWRIDGQIENRFFKNRFLNWC